LQPLKMIVASVLIFILCSSISIYIGFTNPILTLNESQILYLFSTSAQVLAGVYGLTLTGFIFFRNELSREEFDDDSLTDAIESLKDRYFKLLVFITFFSIFTLLICNLAISSESKESSLNVSLINIGQVSFFINLLVIAYFIFDVIAPKRIERASKNLQQKFDPIEENSEKGSLEEFLTNFNQVEYILQKYGQAFQSELSLYQPKARRRISNAKLAQIILQAERIDNHLYEEIKRLITLRNSIVHGEEPVVSYKMVKSSREILEALSKACTGV
jgi:uncharacterized protein YutE (UPF0331/DUF86 family)